MDGENIKIEVKQIDEKGAQKQSIKEVNKKPKEVIVTESVKHVHSASTGVVKPVFNKPGMLTVVALDNNGNEKGNEFNIPEKEYIKYYSDETKFKIKKKAI